MVQKRILASLVALIAIPCLGAGPSAVPINDLISDPFTYDGQTVTIEAEAIGELLERGDHAWINVNDGSNAIGVWLPAVMAEVIGTYGDYDHIGDILRITGVFHRACDEHGGEIDVHAVSLEIITPGHVVLHPFDLGRAFIAGILALSAAGLVTWTIVADHRNRKPVEELTSQE